MTTIAYRDGIMAADGRVTGGNVVRGSARKIAAESGWLIGYAGDFGVLPILTDWIKRGPNYENRLDLSDKISFAAIMVSPDGVVRIVSENMIEQRPDAPFYALGSGNEIAIGAMAAGADAVTAVRLACDHDVWSGPPIMVLSLNGTPDAAGR